MKLERTRTDYSLEITAGDLLAVTAAEDPFKAGHRPALYDVLDKLPGIDNVEYDGHFGAAIYLRIDVEHDTPETHAKVIEAIAEHVQDCRDANEAYAAKQATEAVEDVSPSP